MEQAKQIAERVAEAKARIACRRPFWGVIALMTKYIATNWLPSIAATDCCRTVHYHPERLATLDDAEITGVIMHELLHILFLHNLRMGSRNPEKWNRACDYAINILVVEMGYKLPQMALLDYRYKGKTAEEIYDLLPDQTPNGFDILISIPLGKGGFASDAEAEEYVRDMISKAYTIHKDAPQYGDMPDTIEQHISKLLKPQIPWSRELHKYAGNTIGRTDYTYLPPNKRYMPYGMIVPSAKSYEIGSLVMHIDDSASITTKQLISFASEVAHLVSLVEDSTIIIGDAAVQQVIKTNQIASFLKNVTFKGRGGTNHIPVFEYIEDNRITPELFIGLTDAESQFPDKKPSYPVLWCLTNNNIKPPPWGRSVYIDT